MTGSELTLSLPFIVLAAAPVIVMLVIAFRRSHALTCVLTFTGIVLTLVALAAVSSKVPGPITSLLILDRYALLYSGLVLLAGLAVVLLSYDYLKLHSMNAEEYYVLLLIALLGSVVLTTSSHFASFFLGLEVLSVSLYALVAYTRANERSIEAGVKYLVLAAASASFLLFGMALIYAQLGTMEFSRIAEKLSYSGLRDFTVLTGTALIVVGVGFKLALAPFHLWTPDVYEGAPAPVTAFVATVSKGAMFALLLRYFAPMDLQNYRPLFMMFTVIAIASMFIGNLLALFQNNVKRILAYSSISHLGYLLVALLASGALRVTAVTYYLVAYFVTTLGAFGVVTALSGKDRDADALADYHGLFKNRPWLAGIFTAMLLSLAGIPLTAGFIGKFYVIAAGAGSALWLLVIILVVNSAIGLFYYLRIIIVMYARPAPESAAAGARLSPAWGIVLAVLTALLVWLGVYPAPLVDLIQLIPKGIY